MLPSISNVRFVAAFLTVVAPFASALAPRTQVDKSYDFVIVGGGQAGLVVGSRLAEDTNHTVLVLEAGGNGDDYRERIDTPAYSYFDSLWTTPLNWGYYTAAQPHVSGREIYWPRGKVLGGSSAINGLYLTRPGRDEVNAWHDMLGDMDGADNWSWESFYAAMKKSEKFTPPMDSQAKQANIKWDVSDHGTSGPIHMSYPGFTFSQVGDWTPSLQAIGIEASDQMYGGDNWGGEVATSCINPTNWTRSYSRSGYLDPLPDRGNYDVVANAYVTRILFDDSDPDNITANAVEYTTDGGTTTSKVKVDKEVILSAGSVGSPAVLLYSGVGPKDVLTSAGVDVVSELPGVGQHLQDHLSATLKYTTSEDTAGSIFYQGGDQRSNPLFLTYIDDAVAYVNASVLYGDKAQEQQKNILAGIEQYAPKTTSDEGVSEGYKAICNTTASKIFSSPTGQIELLFMNSDGDGSIGITAALQHPYSHGRIYINSSNPLDYPVIDPNYLNNPADYEILRDGLKLARRLGETDPLASTLTGEKSPGSAVKTDDQWLDWIRESASTEFHPSSSCAMLPRELGGVVDANLRVYGLGNVRVADASVVPIALSTHLMASTYGVAEQASDIIRKFHQRKSSSTATREPPSYTSDPVGNSRQFKGQGSSDDSDDTKSSDSPSGMSMSTWMSMGIVAVHVVVASIFSL
ncbi:Dehydrogenase [Aspergillus sclerotialis]|uniref:glucose oxidase n=1 Tax=Aspergillus sclerotialis TaxID=2070753 RepID=A0A3A2ZPC3_9EURO|nr:Dehydrogenase [Aspergillus sclerotialis]